MCERSKQQTFQTQSQIGFKSTKKMHLSDKEGSMYLI